MVDAAMWCVVRFRTRHHSFRSIIIRIVLSSSMVSSLLSQADGRKKEKEKNQDMAWNASDSAESENQCQGSVCFLPSVVSPEGMFDFHPSTLREESVLFRSSGSFFDGP